MGGVGTGHVTVHAKHFPENRNGITAAHLKNIRNQHKAAEQMFSMPRRWNLHGSSGTVWGEASNQTVHAFEVLVKTGLVFIRDKGASAVIMKRRHDSQ